MNKLKNTPENKERFIALYWGQRVLLDVNNGGEPTLYPIDRSNMYRLDESILELTPFSQISDEDAIEVALMILDISPTRYREKWQVTRDFTITGYPYIKIHNKRCVHSVQIDVKLVNFDVHDMEDSLTSQTDMKPYQVITFLLSKGYYVGDGTEITYGWAKLRESQDLK